MCPIFDFHCDKCGSTAERLTSPLTQTIDCTCGGEMKKQLSAPQIQLDGTDPGFPGAYDKWAKVREQRHKIAVKRNS